MKTRKCGDELLVCLSRGDILPDVLVDVIRQHDITAAVIRGIGALKDVELGYFNIDTSVYEKKFFSGSYELVSLNGNLGWAGDDAVVHLHAAIAGPDLVLHGGHLFKGTVSVTGEVFLRKMDTKIERKDDAASGLKLWHL